MNIILRPYIFQYTADGHWFLSGTSRFTPTMMLPAIIHVKYSTAYIRHSKVCKGLLNSFDITTMCKLTGSSCTRLKSHPIKIQIITVCQLSMLLDLLFGFLTSFMTFADTRDCNGMFVTVRACISFPHNNTQSYYQQQKSSGGYSYKPAQKSRSKSLWCLSLFSSYHSKTKYFKTQV